MKICLYCAKYVNETPTYEPLGIAYIASYLLQKKIIQKKDIHIANNLQEALTFKPDILGITSNSQVLNEARSFAKECKKKLNCLTIIGGYHISCIPNKLPDEFDIGVHGEGEETFSELIQLYQQKTPTKNDFQKIKGICYHNEKEIIVNPKRALISDISSISWPYRHKSDDNVMAVLTSRGCPYKCIFCASHKFWEDKFRQRNAKDVVSEIQFLVETYHPERINIIDDLWMADKKRFREIIEGLIELNIPSKTSFEGFCRSNIIQEEDLILLKKINYTTIRFGAETGSEDHLRRLKGNNISIEDHQRTIDLCKKHSMPCCASFMFGVPGETKEDILATIKFLRKNKGKLSIAGFYLFNPIPGTDLWDSMTKNGDINENMSLGSLQLDFLKNNFSWNDIMYFNRNIVPIEDFKKYILQIKKEFIINRRNILYRIKSRVFSIIRKYFNKTVSKIKQL